MKCIYKNCSINNQIEKAKVLLGKEVIDQYPDFLSENTINLSQALDKLIVKCLNCQVTYKTLDILDIENIAGRHSTFFYYSKEHLLVCLAQYIKKGIENNEYCPIFMQTDWYKDLKQYLKSINAPTGNIEYYPVNSLLEAYISGGLQKMRDVVQELSNSIIEKGFTGIRMVGQPTYAIKLSSKKEFLKFEEVINDGFFGTKVAGLCVYDFNDYIYTNNYIDEEIIEESLKTHTNIHYVCNLAMAK